MNVHKLKIREQSLQVFETLKSHPKLSKFVDHRLNIPDCYSTTGDVKLIILGQDPTVKNPKSREKIKTVLNLDVNGSLLRYLGEICNSLEIDIGKNIFATNLFKNFFIAPPTTIKEINIFREFLPHWLPVLKDEINSYPEALIITLGEPLLSVLVNEDASKLVRYYWGYLSDWQTGSTSAFRYIKELDNILGRKIFPFPHQPSLRADIFLRILSFSLIKALYCANALMISMLI